MIVVNLWWPAMISISCDVSELPHCCGVLEIGSIGGEDPGWSDITVTKPTREEAFASLLERVRTDNPSYGIQTWFVKPKGSDEYHNHELRTLVQAIPGVVNMGTYVNPNTGNTIDGYFWINP